MNKLIIAILFVASFSVLMGYQEVYSFFVLEIPNPEPDPEILENWGQFLALTEDYALVGSPEETVNGENDVGQAHLFNANNGQLIRTFTHPDPVMDSAFGRPVAMDGNNVLIAAFLYDIPFSGTGIVYLFDATTGNLVHTFLNPSPSPEDLFGISIAIKENNILIVGPSVAYLYDVVTGNLIHVFNNPAGGPVALSETYAVVGTQLFDLTTKNLIHTFVNPDPEIGDGFGFWVAISGNNVVISDEIDSTDGFKSGRAYLFDASTGNLVHTFSNPDPEEHDIFGHVISVSGNNIVIGEILDNSDGEDSGRAHLFDAVSGNLIETFVNPDPEIGDRFGIASISGNNVLIGAGQDDKLGPDTGTAYLFLEFPPTQLVGGEIIPMETTSLLLANTQSFSWMIPVLLSGIGIGLFVFRKSENS